MAESLRELIQRIVPTPCAKSEERRNFLHIGRALGKILERLDAADSSVAASTTASVPVGAIVFWSGSVGDIPAGWALANGVANATGSGLDLTGYYPKFDASTSGTQTAAGNTGSGGDHDHGAATGSGGSHDHGGATGSGGSHNHGGATGSGGSHDHGGATGSGGAHDHGGTTAKEPTGITLDNHATVGTGEATTGSDIVVTDGSHGINEPNAGAGHEHDITNEAAHTHTISTQTGHTHTISTQTGHTHTISSQAAHTHTISSQAAHTHTAGEPANITLIPIEYLGV